MNYNQSMEYIRSRNRFGSNYGLSRTEKILELLGNPHNKIRCIHIGGTNGKGSTTAMISSVLKESGYKVGMYTSPFIEEFEERIQINSENISKKALSNVISKVKEAVDKLPSFGYDEPTEFEVITCAAFLHFYIEQVDYAVIEVGLGGRLDSTNVITPILSVITSISYDHMDILGDNLEKIALEKAGIIKKGVPLVLYPQILEVEALIEGICSDKQSHLIKVPLDSVNLLEVNEKNGFQKLILNTSKETYIIELSLLGKHQLLNCATAIYALEVIRDLGGKIENTSIISALSKVKWIGRLEVVSKKPWIVVDGAHNIDGIIKLKESIETYFEYNNLILILGILADKQVHEMVNSIAPMASKVICVTPNSKRAEISHKLKDIVVNCNENSESFESYTEALNKAISYMKEGDLLLVSGSLYMIGDMRKKIKALFY